MLRDILQIDSSSLSLELSHVVGVVDRLHRLPKIVAFPVRLNKSRLQEGAYISTSNPPRPQRIEISVYARYPGWTLLHELGHLIDHVVLNPIKRGFVSEHDSAFDPLRVCWQANRMIRKLRSLSVRKRAIPPAHFRKFLAYQLKPYELWARTYAQWVTSKSGDILLRSHLGSMQIQQRSSFENATEYAWDDQEFDAIIPVVDELFKQAGFL